MTEEYDRGGIKWVLHCDIQTGVSRYLVELFISEICQHYLAQTGMGSLEWVAL